MKKLWDKPYKTSMYLIVLLISGTVILKGDINFNKVSVRTAEETQITKEVAVIEPSKKEITVIEPSKEEVVPDIERKRQPKLSRGGGVGIKQPTEREIINSYIQEISARYKIDPYLIMSVVQTESEYNPKARNGKCVGLMQVSSYWHKERSLKLGVKDFYDPYGNILIGVDYISELLKTYKDPRLVLMLYNMDHNTAIKLYKSGHISSYATTIMLRAEKYKKGE